VADEQAPPGAGTTSPSTRQWILVGVLAGVLVLILAVVVLRPLLAGSNAPISDAAPPPTTAPPATVPPGSTPPGGVTATSAPRSLAPAIAARAVRNPFTPLVAAVTDTTAPVSDGGIGVTPTTSVTGDTPAPTPTTGGTTGSTATDTTTGRELSLTSIEGSGTDRTVTVSIESQSYTGAEGDTLAGAYLVVNISSDCADFERTADQDTFTLCTGDSALK
jgi:hypothetical protein